MVIMAKGMDFESSDTKEASRAHSDFFPAAENRRLGASVASSSKSFFSCHQHAFGKETGPQDDHSLVGGMAAWCKSVVVQLEQAVPRSAQQKLKENNFSSMQLLFGTCLPKVRGAKVAIATSSPCAFPSRGRKLQMSTRCTDDDDIDDARGITTVVWATATKRFREIGCSMSNNIALGLVALLGGSAKAVELRASACGVLATVLMPLATGDTALTVSTGGPVMAFCPIDFGCLGSSFSMSQCASMRELSLQELEKGVLVATFVQGSLGIVRICLGDAFSGCYGLLLATLGYNSRRPGPASNWLKTYVLITFINGTMSCIDLIQNMLLQNYPVILPALPLSVNAAHLVTLTVPWVSFLGAYCGWQHIQMQRKVAIQAYRQQLTMLMEQPPWPPPPLPFPLPGMPGFQMVEDDEDEAMQMRPGSQPFPKKLTPSRGLAPVQEEAEEAETEIVEEAR
jgi:hypothetical protein